MVVVAAASLTAVAGTIVKTQQAARPSGRGQPVDPATREQERRLRFTPDSASVDLEGNLATAAAVEASAGFDSQTNGFDPQGPDFGGITEGTVAPLNSFNDNRFIFEEVERTADGLGPTYNAQSCRECRQNVVTGGASQVTEQRTGHLSGGAFFESLGGSLIQSRATYPRRRNSWLWATMCGRSASRPTRWGWGSWRRYRTGPFSISETTSRRVCAAPRRWFPCLKPTVARASDDLAGRGSTPVSSPSPPMRT